MHRDVDDAAENGEDAIVGFGALFEFEIFVPERMSQEVQADAVSSSFKKPVDCSLVFDQRMHGVVAEAGR